LALLTTLAVAALLAAAFLSSSSGDERGVYLFVDVGLTPKELTAITERHPGGRRGATGEEYRAYRRELDDLERMKADRLAARLKDGLFPNASVTRQPGSRRAPWTACFDSEPLLAGPREWIVVLEGPLDGAPSILTAADPQGRCDEIRAEGIAGERWLDEQVATALRRHPELRTSGVVAEVLWYGDDG
jgi:hypothetical protein